jgi:hypothetical protein
MKLNKDPFLMNMNMVELDGRKVLVQPSLAESTKGNKVIIGEEQTSGPKGWTAGPTLQPLMGWLHCDTLQ